MSTYVLMAGLPGTGKSTLARVLALKLNGIVLSKDIVREALFAGPLTDYTRDQDDLCFRAVLEAAEYLATRNSSGFIFLDGRTFSQRQQIDQAIAASEASGSAWKILHTTCPDAIVEARLARDADNHPAMNRSMALYREIKARFEPITRIHRELDTAQPLARSIEQSLAYLQPTCK